MGCFFQKLGCQFFIFEGPSDGNNTNISKNIMNRETNGNWIPTIKRNSRSKAESDRISSAS